MCMCMCQDMCTFGAVACACGAACDGHVCIIQVSNRTREIYTPPRALGGMLTTALFMLTTALYVLTTALGVLRGC